MAAVRSNHFDQIANALHKAGSQTVRKVAFDLQANAQSFAPVETGFLKNSIYVVTNTSSTYGQAGDPPRDSYLLAEVEKPTDDMTARVGVGANYGLYVEFGTRFMTAQPYFFPAVELAQGALDDAMAAIEDRLRELMQ